MILRYISLFVEHGTIPEEDSRVFHANINFILNYLSRNIRQLNIKTDNTFNQICVELTLKDNPDSVTNLFKTISIHEQLKLEDWAKYKSLKQPEARYEYCLALLEDGYQRAAQLKSLPVQSLLGLHDKFRTNGYRNEWLFKKKTLREYGLNIVLTCFLTAFDFRLELEAFPISSNVLICKGIVLQTSPFEESYAHILRDVRTVDNKLEIIDFLGFANITIDLHLLNTSVFEAVFHDDPRYKDSDWYIGWDKRNADFKEYINSITW